MSGEESFQQAVFVVEEVGVAEIRALDMGGAISDGPDVGGERFGIAPVEAFITFPQCFGDRTGQGFSRLPGERLGETVGLGVFDV